MGLERGPRPESQRRERLAEAQRTDAGRRERFAETQRSDPGRRERLAEAQQRARERTAAYEVRSFRPGSRGEPRRARRWGVLLATAAVILVIAWVVLPPLVGGLLRAVAEENPDLMRFGVVADAVAQVMEDRPDVPAGTDPTPVEFVIAQGSSSRDITDDLVDRELVRDRLAFTWVLVKENALDNLRFGTHILNRTMTPRQVAVTLQGTPDPAVGGITVAPRQGLRIEQITALLLTMPELPFDAAEFYELAVDPPAEIRSDYSMLASLPAGASLEGFLTAGVFELEDDSTAEDLLRMMLDAREAEIDPLIPVAKPAVLADFYEVLTVASIVEAETRDEGERPTIAGVYLNRLDQAKWPTRLLNADPTVIYGNDTQQLRDIPLLEWDEFIFWGLPGTSMGDVILDGELAGFQSYKVRGLPPGPIRSPSVSSIEAVLRADLESGYLYFVSKNDGTGTHAFARTLDEHQRNIETYLGTPEPPSAEPTDALPSSPVQSGGSTPSAGP